MPQKITKKHLKEKVKYIESELGLKLKIDSYTPDKETFYKLEAYDEKPYKDEELYIHHFEAHGDEYFNIEEFNAHLRGCIAVLDWQENKKKYISQAKRSKDRNAERIKQINEIELKSGKLKKKTFLIEKGASSKISTVKIKDKTLIVESKKQISKRALEIQRSFNLSPEKSAELDKLMTEVEQSNVYDDIDKAMDKFNKEIGGYGVEPITKEDNWVNKYYGNIIGLYVNMGDTYDTTVVYDTAKDKFHIWNWGDFLTYYGEEEEGEGEEEEEEDNNDLKEEIITGAKGEKESSKILMIEDIVGEGVEIDEDHIQEYWDGLESNVYRKTILRRINSDYSEVDQEPPFHEELINDLKSKRYLEIEEFYRDYIFEHLKESLEESKSERKFEIASKNYIKSMKKNLKEIKSIKDLEDFFEQVNIDLNQEKYDVDYYDEIEKEIKKHYKKLKGKNYKAFANRVSKRFQ